MRNLLIAAGLLLAGNAHAWTDLSFYGDSFVFRSGWNCAGVDLQNKTCEEHKWNSSFVTHVPKPYPYVTTPVYNVVHKDGIGGSSCLGSVQNPLTLADRLEDNGEEAIVVMMGINDLNLGGRSVQETVDCLVAAWTVIADDFNAAPIAIKYPPIDANTTVWNFAPLYVNGATARQNTLNLNSAISAAANAFNQNRTVNRVQVVNFGNAYSPAPGTYTTDGVHPTPAGAVRLAQYFFWYLH